VTGIQAIQEFLRDTEEGRKIAVAERPGDHVPEKTDRELPVIRLARKPS